MQVSVENEIYGFEIETDKLLLWSSISRSLPGRFVSGNYWRF